MTLEIGANAIPATASSKSSRDEADRCIIADDDCEYLVVGIVVIVNI